MTRMENWVEDALERRMYVKVMRPSSLLAEMMPVLRWISSKHDESVNTAKRRRPFR